MMTARETPLRRGWTTGSCATAAAKAAWTALHTGQFPDPVRITLPGGKQVDFALAGHGFSKTGAAWASVIKDAGDDPDVTHGAPIRADVRLLPRGRDVVFVAGAGVGRITRPGLPLPPGEPAINPGPRQMIRAALREVTGTDTDAEVTVSIQDGERLAGKTLNGRLGIVGGLSVLGTTGIVMPFSCSAWIDSIRRGIDVARAMGLPHLAASTGHVSETAVRNLYALPEPALIEMGDFVGGVLKYIRDHAVERLTIAGGIAKMTKLAQGRLDLHSRRGTADMSLLARYALEAGVSQTVAEAIEYAPSVSEAFLLAGTWGIPLGNHIAQKALNIALDVLGEHCPTRVDVLLFDRTGCCIGQSASLNTHDRNRLR